MICKKKFFLAVILIVYMVTVITHSFFPKTSLNKILSTKIVFVYFYSFPALFGCIIGIISILALLIVFYKSKVYYLKNIVFFMWGGFLILSIILILFGSGIRKNNIALSSTKTFKVVEWNAGNHIGKEDIYTIFKEFDTDIAVFPELEGYYKGDISNKRLKDLFESSNLYFNKYEAFISPATEGNIAPVTIVVKKSFSSYEIKKNSPMTRFGTVYLQTKDQNSPDIVGLHTAPPLPGLIDDWKRDLNLISSDIIIKHSNAIIIGDFNATLKHGTLNDITTHDDVLNYLPWFQRGTWSTDLPSCFCTPIDHILLPKNEYFVKKVNVLNLSRSDHKAIFVEIAKEK